SELRTRDGGFQHTNCFVIDPEWHGIWMSVLAAVRKGKPSGIREAIWCSVHDLGHHRQGLDSPRAHTRCQEEFREVGRPTIKCNCEIRRSHRTARIKNLSKLWIGPAEAPTTLASSATW